MVTFDLPLLLYMNTGKKMRFFSPEELNLGSEPEPKRSKILCLQCTKVNSGKTNATIRFSGVGFPTKPYNIQYCDSSYDEPVGTWSDLSENRTLYAYEGRRYFFKGINDSLGFSSTQYYRFTLADGEFEVYGSPMSLLDGTGESTKIQNPYAFVGMFENCSAIKKPPELPATELSNNCYEAMFKGSGITYAPELPATTLKNNCYKNMFSNCKSMISPMRTLPATTVANASYSHMFESCEKLETTPVIEAVTISEYSMEYMFRYCTKIKSCEIKAVTIPNFGIWYMFFLCSSMEYIKVAFTSWNKNGTQGWVDSVASVGEFHCPSTLPEERGSTYIPSGWEIIND